MNTWIRTPGIILNSYTVYQAILYGNHVSPLWAAWLHVILPPYNALYYNKQAIGNFAVYVSNSFIARPCVYACARVRPPRNVGRWQVPSVLLRRGRPLGELSVKVAARSIEATS